MLGIKCLFECPACGNIIRTSSPFWTAQQRRAVLGPSRCGCGRKGGFTLMDFEKCEFEVKK